MQAVTNPSRKTPTLTVQIVQTANNEDVQHILHFITTKEGLKLNDNKKNIRLNRLENSSRFTNNRKPEG